MLRRNCLQRTKLARNSGRLQAFQEQIRPSHSFTLMIIRVLSTKQNPDKKLVYMINLAFSYVRLTCPVSSRLNFIYMSFRPKIKKCLLMGGSNFKERSTCNLLIYRYSRNTPTGIKGLIINYFLENVCVRPVVQMI